MENIKQFKNINSLNSFLREVATKQLSHGFLLISEDEFTARAGANILALNLVCESENIPCYECSSCQKIMNSTSVDVFEYPKKKSILVEDIKEIIETASTTPLDFDKKIYILNNIVNATLASQNKLLKTLEEPAKNVIFILTASSRQAVLPTIASRTKTINLPKATNEELISVLKTITTDNKRLTIAVESSEGNLGKALEILSNEAYFEIYEFVLNMLNSMKTSQDVLGFSSVIVKNYKFANTYFDVMLKLFRDLLIVKSETPELVFNKYSYNLLLSISQNYSEKAIIKIIKKILEHKKMLKFNTNPTGVIDTLLVGILEVKYRWK